jgi:hypothetical protein
MLIALNGCVLHSVAAAAVVKTMAADTTAVVTNNGPAMC